MEDRIKLIETRLVYLEDEEWNRYLEYKRKHGVDNELTNMQFGKWQALKSLLNEFGLEAK